MGKALNINPGDKFKIFEIIEYDPDKKSNTGARYYNCKCECGELMSISTTDLRSKTQYLSCRHKRYDDLTNKIFGNIKVTKLIGKSNKRGLGGGDMIWEYQCLICNKIKTSRSDSIKNGSVISCGKLRCKTNFKQYESNYYKKHKNCDWRLKIIEKFNKTCQICFSKNDLEAHHLNAKKSYPEQKYDLENGTCLCHNCHMKFHSKYGRGKNTKLDFQEFLNVYN